MSEKTVSPMRRTVIVKPGDTLQSIAAHFYGDDALASELARVNGIAVSAILTAGENVRVPHRAQLRRPALTHQVGALPTDVPVFEPAPGQLPEVVATGVKPWWMNKTLWIGAAAGVALAFVLHSLLKKGKAF